VADHEDTRILLGYKQEAVAPAYGAS